MAKRQWEIKTVHGFTEHGSLDEGLGFTRTGDVKKILKEYKENEANNLHTENYLLLAKAFGTSQEVKKIEAILKKQGYTSNEDMDWMYEHINPYCKKLIK
tara:strand:+ start:267 stop:566 length:300 start_codon:yes stop_codon:yes gene_type:complete